MKNIKIYAFADEADAKIDAQITAMKRNRLDGLEIRNVDGENVSSITAEKAEEVRRKLEQNGLAVWSVGSPIGKINIDDDFSAELERLKHTAEIACILGTENIRMFSFFVPEGRQNDYKNEVIDRIGKMADTAEKYGAVLCHENEKFIYGDNADRCFEILSAVPSVKGVFDPANFVQCGQETWEAWQKLKPFIKYMHIKDALAEEKTVVPSGKGDGNVEKIVSDYIASGGVDFTVEPHLTVFEGFDALEKENVKKSVGGYVFASADEAFDCACDSFKNILKGKY